MPSVRMCTMAAALFYFALPFGVCRALLVACSVEHVQCTPSLATVAKRGIHPNGFAKRVICRAKTGGQLRLRELDKLPVAGYLNGI